MFDIPNINVPIIIFLALFGLYMLFFIFYSIFNVYHLIRYGIYGFGLYLIITIFTGGTIILVSASFITMNKYNWSQPLQLEGVIDQLNSDIFQEI
jgi:hypothetical protein